MTLPAAALLTDRILLAAHVVHVCVSPMPVERKPASMMRLPWRKF